MKFFKKVKSNPTWIRLLSWEYWPFQMLYAPIYLVWVWYGIRARSFFFFGASNPTIKNAGFLMESKKEIYDLIPDEYRPITLFFKATTPIDLVTDSIRNYNLEYPLIIKPDIGMQGKAVVKVNSGQELMGVIAQFSVDYLIQPFIHYPNEIGIFYVRFPDESKGSITGIVEKEFLTVTGDGFSTIEELLHHNPRYILQLKSLSAILGMEKNKVLGRGESSILVPYGNHARGSLFLDSSHKNNPQLETMIDKVCKSVDHFYYGRLDIRFNSWEELIQGKNWTIIELNGAGSEPTHIYDPGHSLLFAWKEIIRHWKMLYKISVQNNRNGFPFLSLKDGIAMFRANTSYVNKLNEIQFVRSNTDLEKRKTLPAFLAKEFQ
jgi:hypothetical protein